MLPIINKQTVHIIMIQNMCYAQHCLQRILIKQYFAHSQLHIINYL